MARRPTERQRLEWRRQTRGVHPVHSARYTGRRPAGTIRIRLATDVRGSERLEGYRLPSKLLSADVRSRA